MTDQSIGTKPSSARQCARLTLLTPIIAAVLLGSGPALAETITVNTAEDEINEDDDCSLREAIRSANLDTAVDGCDAGSGADEITLPAGTYTLVIPGQNEDAATTGDLDIRSDLTITGAGAATTIIDGGGLDRVFHAAPPVFGDITVTISGVTVQNGDCRSSDCVGGGILNHNVDAAPSTLTLSDCTVRNNFSGGPGARLGGGGIYNRGTLTVTNCTVSANTGGDGGGINNWGTLAVTNSTISGNTGVVGGGIFLYGVVSITDSFITDNTGSVGGGIASEGSLTLTRSTVSGNRANANGGGIMGRAREMIADSTVSGNISGSDGGGIVMEVFDTMTVTNSTISGNVASRSGGGIAKVEGVALTLNGVTIANNAADYDEDNVGNGGGIIGAGISLRNTIIGRNADRNRFTQAPDCAATLSSQGFNLIQDTAGCMIGGDLTGNLIDVDPKLGPLGPNGGPTLTHALRPGSPAIDAGNPAAPGSGGNACEATDQRGVSRPAGVACDIGAFEFEVTGDLAAFEIVPRQGGNRGSVLTVVYGNRFEDGTTVKLVRAGQPDIVGNPVTVGRAGTAAAASFDLTGKATGPWDVVVTNPSRNSATLPQAFTIEEGRAAQLWVDILGRSRIRVGRPAMYRFLVGNRGNVDALGVPLLIALPGAFAWSPSFPVAPPPPQEGQVPTDWNQVAIDIVAADFPDQAVLPLLLPVVPAGFTRMLELTLTAPHPLEFTIEAIVFKPFFQPALNPDVVNFYTESVREFVREASGVVLPPKLIPELQRYLTTQLASLVERGTNAWVDNLFTQGGVYSEAQLLVDLAQFAAARAGAPLALDAPTNVNRLFPAEPVGQWISRAANARAQREERSRPQEISRTTRGLILEGWSTARPPHRLLEPHDVPIGVVQGSSREARCWGCSASNRAAAADDGSVRRGLGGASEDPNDKVGATGTGEARYLSGDEPLRYAIFFENLETAALPAQEVVITDQLDAEKVDLDTLSLGPIAFGDQSLVPPPGLREFTDEVDLWPAQNLLVRIYAALDKATGVLTWRFRSLDPMTGELPEDPLGGFLPPNVNPPEGEGSVIFTVRPKAGLPTGTEVRNRARIVFDVNEPIDTPEWPNTIDNSPPASQVLALAPTQASPSFLVQWAGSDEGSGIADYTLLVSEDGGPFTPWLVNTGATSETFTGQAGMTYGFSSVARDQTGNVEDAPPAADAVTRVVACTGDCNGDARVTIDELVTGVNIALGSAALGSCAVLDANGDGSVKVNELVTAVNNALNGC